MNDGFEADVRQLTAKYVAAWRELPSEKPRLRHRFTRRQQRENERQLELHLKKVPTSLEMYEALPDAEKPHISLDVLKAIVGTSILSDDGFSDRYFENSESVTRHFVNTARKFDPSLPDSDIHQALRNLWVFNSVQLFLGKEVALTPSSFAYSLLYPYVDNGLDSNERTMDDKCRLAHWLSHWFERTGCDAIDDLTEKIARLLSMIREEYPCEMYPQVYQSLLAIQVAQQKSLSLHDSPTRIGDGELIEITVEKGGTSVLVDGYLAKGVLCPETLDPIFEFGVILQFIDDLQDLEEDANAHQLTPFQVFLENGCIENATIRLLQLVRRCAGDLGSLMARGSSSMPSIIERSCTFLVSEAVVAHCEYYSRAFVQMLEPFMPLRAEFLREMRNRMKADQGSAANGARLEKVSIY